MSTTEDLPIGATSWFHKAPCSLLATDIDGTVVEVNDTFLAWTGHRREDLVGLAFSDLLDEGSRLIHETRHRPVLQQQGVVREVALTVRAVDGSDRPALVSAKRDDDDGVVRYAIFDAAGRVRYEQDLLCATRIAERSEERVRVLQEVSAAFDVSATDRDVAESFATVARDAFAARGAAVFLAQEDGELVLSGGSNPLEGKVAPIPALRAATAVTVVRDDDPAFPELCEAMRASDVASLCVTPMIADGRRLGLLVCFYDARVDFDAHFFDLQQALGREASQTLIRVRLQRELARLALHDQLTGVANRQLLQLTLDDALSAAAAGNEPLSVLFLDLDDFKSVNDAFGHAAGDHVLVELATRLRRGVRGGDVVGRIGGDEFVAVCPGADAQAAEAVARRILALCREPIAVDDGIISASVSLGIAVHRPDLDPPVTAQQLLVRADAAMYNSKRAGKDRITLNA